MYSFPISRVARIAAVASLVASGASACKDSTGAKTAPAPVLSAVSPDTASAGRSTATFAVSGSDFRKESLVHWNGAAIATQYVSSTELRATVAEAQLQAPGAASITVVTPQPGGGTSAPVAFSVIYGRPAVTSLSADTVTTGQSSGSITITGSGFTPASTVQWNGNLQAVTYQSPTRLGVILNATGVQPGTLPLTVSNPAPGGSSDPVTVRIQAPIPTLSSMPSQGATAGRPGFTLTLHGSSFMQGAGVLWNGTPRSATFVSPTRLDVAVSSSDVASPTDVAIRVANPGPVARTSGTITLNVRALGAATITVQRVSLVARDIVWDGGTERLYLSIPGSAGALGNTVAAVNPATGTVTGSVPVGSEPHRMARSDDGQYLYVGVNGANGVRRVTLSNLSAGLQWALPAGEVADDIEVMPGHPTTVAVSRHQPGLSPSLQGVTIYDDGVARPTSSGGHTGGARIAFLDSPSVLYGYNNDHTGFEFFTIAVDASGARHSVVTSGLVSGFYTDILGVAGRIYGTNGSVVDAERRRAVGVIGRGISVAVDAAVGRAFVLRDSFDGGGIAVYDLNNFQLLGTLSLPSSPSFPHPAAMATRLVRWGQDGLAFLSEDELFIIRSPLVAP
jgi:hypothetical protein